MEKLELVFKIHIEYSTLVYELQDYKKRKKSILKSFTWISQFHRKL